MRKILENLEYSFGGARGISTDFTPSSISPRNKPSIASLLTLTAKGFSSACVDQLMIDKQ